MTATPDTAAPQARSRRDPQAGPPPGVLAVVFTALFLAGLVLSTLLAGGRPLPLALRVRRHGDLLLP
ncbi:hypothetical protein PL81_10435 [Streptomyces sp. RSD-27]|nr:hypothetical protein PL81_10435 [Streptomyces sp. RSD-27]